LFLRSSKKFKKIIYFLLAKIIALIIAIPIGIARLIAPPTNVMHKEIQNKASSTKKIITEIQAIIWAALSFEKIKITFAIRMRGKTKKPTTKLKKSKFLEN
jgi:hypothetical protein